MSVYKFFEYHTELSRPLDRELHQLTCENKPDSLQLTAGLKEFIQNLPKALRAKSAGISATINL
ncbi:hypothetical protein KIN20_002545 [Parelaphostrongylus tenuis]|uniref:Uncharacterized protein n=1 Tax=Parelaphostrongylus tenuis TaxID=148309 RepID=A0AAD5MED2_PARTN|nr:hypothetical protein KIN20_002545 [Parelaphostrongylus tenuis]